ncbi:hypothetical protein AKJ09_10558 [Labilithrix luteola]|uniref:Uncharacterized protein n=1 Tax=Labilithrix luteola TaxID=1391654 RepID=A0A0K1QEN7_9BACT|nr:hypothetical protein AKJ09_10558 [Labilithrix luteola]
MGVTPVDEVVVEPSPNVYELLMLPQHFALPFPKAAHAKPFVDEVPPPAWTETMSPNDPGDILRLSSVSGPPS